MAGDDIALTVLVGGGGLQSSMIGCDVEADNRMLQCPVSAAHVEGTRWDERAHHL